MKLRPIKFPKNWRPRNKQRGFIINPYRYASSGSSSPGDTFLNDTVLNLRGVTLTDSSPSVHTVTVVGDAQVSSAQSIYNGFSYLFDGTGDYLTLDGSTEFAPGTSDFTLEIAYRPTTSAVQEMLYDSRPASTNGLYITVYRDSANKLIFYTNSAVRITGTTSMGSGAWYRIKICRTNGVTVATINGVQEGSSYTDTNSYLNGASRPCIGASGHTVANDNLNGYLSHIRFTRASRFPGTTFKNDTVEYSITNWLDGYWNDVICHINGDGTDGATTTLDRSLNSATWAFNGNAQIDTAQSYIGSSSILCDGTTDWIDTPDTANWFLDTSNFTIEFDVRFNSVPASLMYIAGQINSSLTGTTGSFHIAKTAANVIQAQCYTAAGAALGSCTGTTVVTTGVWYRVIYQRRGSDFSLIIDTIQEATASSATAVNNSSNNISFARAGEYASNTLDGWIANIRVTLEARYVAPIIRPRLAHPTIEGDLYPWHVVFQSDFTGTDASTDIYDESKYSRAVTARGNAQIDTAQYIFTPSSLLCDGTGDYGEIADAAELSHGTHDFSIEAGLRFASVPASDFYVYAQSDTTATQASRSILLYKTSGNKIGAASYSGSASIVNPVGTTTVVANTWYEAGFHKKGSNYYLGVDGNIETTASSATAINNSASILSLGRFGAYTGGGDFNGWIDTFRHTIGVCRKTAKYVKRRIPFPVIGW